MPYASRLFNNEYIEMKIGKFLWELPFFMLVNYKVFRVMYLTDKKDELSYLLLPGQSYICEIHF